MLLFEALKYGIKRLQSLSGCDCRSDALLLLEHCSQIEFQQYLLKQSEEMKESALAHYLSCLDRRCEGEPVQYITNKAYFMGHEFYVDESVLIPRFDTEVLVSTVSDYIQPKMKVLDLCTGSGCILISLMKECDEIIGIGSDISKAALKIARKNADKNKVTVELIHSDLFKNITGVYDIIVSNPPYINKKDREKLDREVIDHEPHLALFGGDDGLDYYKKIIAQSPKYLSKNGRIFLEIGYDQLEAVSELLEKAGFEEIVAVCDLNNIDRAVCARRGNYELGN